ncbi:ribonuclease P/MRP protein subunit POP5 [Geosmithia morbida]|uniref:Ribonuclease P/MRP protein subunit POP5 n=1 Tax=Geosmithia morbida TaxID=1094350 RepID=A0A9P4Z033_9HYPO|nr:ribonuclease P/MRP protein subunit POP5 [Geosmithia morbida]KAF4125230.1 ribonuclease P/MRP protein subunit POP5 [Geosmithia morbida]
MVRLKERYLLVNIVYLPDAGSASGGGSVPNRVVQHRPTTDKLTHQTLLKAIRAEIATLFGEYGSGALDGTIWVKYLSLATSTFIIRCPRAHYQMLWAALTFMDHVPAKDGRGQPCIFRVVRVSGTIRKAEEEAIRQARMHILAAEAEHAHSLFTSTLSSSLPDTSGSDGRESVAMDVTDDESDDNDESMMDADG